MTPDTIYAQASGLGKAGVAVIRLSGDKCLDVLKALTQKDDFTPRYAYFCSLAFAGQTLDSALVLYFKGPHSFTGEDVAELHVHGGTAVIASIFRALSALGCRPAERGEFSRRAVLNGKMDLTQAEGIMDLVDAQTSEQARQSLDQVQGGLYKLLENWRQSLVKIQGYLEAFIDFPEEDIPPEKQGQIRDKVHDLIASIAHYLDNNDGARRLKEGFKVVLCGRPNVGKSSLLNAFMKQEVAIVSAIPGTTRDVVRGYVDIKGFPVVLLDTAGLHTSRRKLEQQGMERTKSSMQEADLILHLQEAKNFPHTDDLEVKDKLVLDVWTKADLPHKSLPPKALLISTRTGQGIDDLWQAIAHILQEHYNPHQTLLTRERYRVALQEALQSLQRSLTAPAIELQAEEIRLAARSLGRITGVIYTDEILDVIFKEFCIGK